MGSAGAAGPPAEEEMPELSDGEAWEDEEEEEGAAEGPRTRCLFCDRWVRSAGEAPRAAVGFPSPCAPPARPRRGAWAASGRAGPAGGSGPGETTSRQR